MASEIVAEFDDPGHAGAAKANLDLFLQWALTADLTKPVPPALILVISQTKLNPHEDLPRKSDWGGAPPRSRLEGAAVVIEAPRSKHAREVVAKVLHNSKPLKVSERAAAGGGAGSRLVLAIVAALVVLGGAAAAFFLLHGGGGR